MYKRQVEFEKVVNSKNVAAVKQLGLEWTQKCDTMKDYINKNGWDKTRDGYVKTFLHPMSTRKNMTYYHILLTPSAMSTDDPDLWIIENAENDK